MHNDAFLDSMMAAGFGSTEEAGALLAMQTVDCILTMASSFDSLSDQVTPGDVARWVVGCTSRGASSASGYELINLVSNAAGGADRRTDDARGTLGRE